MSTARKDTEALLRRLRRLGYTVEHTRGGHVRVHTPRGPVITTASAGGGRGYSNFVAALRRHGVPL